MHSERAFDKLLCGKQLGENYAGFSVFFAFGKWRV